MSGNYSLRVHVLPIIGLANVLINITFLRMRHYLRYFDG